MNNNITIFIIFWGIWILLPIMVDAVLAIIQMIVVLIWGRDSKKPKMPPVDKLPLVTVIIPTYNEEENITQCLNFLKIQTYPHKKLEIIVVDNGSVDKTRATVNEHINNGDKNNWGYRQNKKINRNDKIRIHGVDYPVNEFGGVIDLVTKEEKSKAKALNEGIMRARGDIIMNIDCRSFLAPDAIYNMVAKFIEDPDMDVATGNIEINWQFIYEKDKQGKLVKDLDGIFKAKFLSIKEAFLSKCQFLEYLVSFRLGRQFQGITGSMYTLSGAFSAFRKHALYTLYSTKSVSEDTDITLALQRRHKIGYVPDAKAYLRPITSFERLYAQRVRWQRGELEVFGLHQTMLLTKKYGFSKGIFYALTLFIDHTFAFPRLVWTFLLPVLFLFGYSPALIATAIALMIGFYIVLDFINTLCCYAVVDIDTKRQIRHTFHYNFVLWFYRLLIFYFRVSASLIVLKEPPEWMVKANPLSSAKKTWSGIKTGLFNFKNILKRKTLAPIGVSVKESDNDQLENREVYAEKAYVPSAAETFQKSWLAAKDNDRDDEEKNSEKNSKIDLAANFKKAWEAAKMRGDDDSNLDNNQGSDLTPSFNFEKAWKTTKKNSNYFRSNTNNNNEESNINNRPKSSVQVLMKPLKPEIKEKIAVQEKPIIQEKVDTKVEVGDDILIGEGAEIEGLVKGTIAINNGNLVIRKGSVVIGKLRVRKIKEKE